MMDNIAHQSFSKSLDPPLIFFLASVREVMSFNLPNLGGTKHLVK